MYNEKGAMYIDRTTNYIMKQHNNSSRNISFLLYIYIVLLFRYILNCFFIYLLTFIVYCVAFSFILCCFFIYSGFVPYILLLFFIYCVAF